MRAARAGAECASMSVSRSWMSAMRCGSVAVSASASRLARSVSADSTQSIRLSSPPGASCATWPMRALRGIEMAPSSGADSPFDQAQQRRLAGAVAADEADLVAGRDCGRRPLEDRFALDAVGEIIDVQHQARR